MGGESFRDNIFVLYTQGGAYVELRLVFTSAIKKDKHGKHKKNNVRKTSLIALLKLRVYVYAYAYAPVKTNLYRCTLALLKFE